MGKALKFKRIKRPKLKAKIIRHAAEVCPWCGAVEPFVVVSTQKRDGKIYRYSKCRACGRSVTRVYSLP